MSKLIVIEGIDGSGKGTQSKLLKTRLEKEKYNLYNLDFPQYNNQSSYFVRRYLNGSYGPDPSLISPKQASLCYAMDRFDYFKEEETQKILTTKDAILLANRYTTSNILFQATKAKNKEEIYKLIDWICELEYDILQIPKPDMVIMPYVEIEKNIEMLTKRNIQENAKKNNMTKDIHEQNINYLRKVHEASMIIAERMNFDIINCMDNNNEIRTPEDIHDEIYSKVYKKVLKKLK